MFDQASSIPVLKQNVISVTSAAWSGHTALYNWLYITDYAHNSHNSINRISLQLLELLGAQNSSRKTVLSGCGGWEGLVTQRPSNEEGEQQQQKKNPLGFSNSASL